MVSHTWLTNLDFFPSHGISFHFSMVEKILNLCYVILKLEYNLQFFNCATVCSIWQNIPDLLDPSFADAANAEMTCFILLLIYVLNPIWQLGTTLVARFRICRNFPRSSWHFQDFAVIPPVSIWNSKGKIASLIMHENSMGIFSPEKNWKF